MKHLCTALVVSLLAFACAACGPTYSSGPVFRGDISAKPVTAEVLSLSEPLYSLPAGEHNCELIFCDTKPTDASPTYRPTILRRDSDGWKVLDFNFEPFGEGSSWIGVFAAGPRIWAMSAWTMEDPGTVIQLASSDDGGRTWRHIAAVEKPDYLSHLVLFRIGPSGQGNIVFLIEDLRPDIGSWEYYECRTKNWGRSWTKPIQLGNIALPGVPLTDSNKPDLKKLLTNK